MRQEISFRVQRRCFPVRRYDHSVDQIRHFFAGNDRGAGRNPMAVALARGGVRQMFNEVAQFILIPGARRASGACFSPNVPRRSVR